MPGFVTVRPSPVLVLGLAALVACIPEGTAWASISGAQEGPGPGTVSVSASGGSSLGGGTGGPGGVSAGSGRGASGGSTVCTSMPLVLNDQGGFAPGGPTPGGWYSVTCTNSATGAQLTQTVWIAGQVAAPQPSADPYAVALDAERNMTLPKPAVFTDPSGTAVVNLPTWLWVDGSIWHPMAVTASVGAVSATAVATPVSVAWSMGDGHSLTCAGPGTPFPSGASTPAATSDCSYTYPESSAGQPSPDGRADDGSFAVVAAVTWRVTWASIGTPGGGTLPTLVTSTASRLRVEQIESVNTDPQALGVIAPAGPTA